MNIEEAADLVAGAKYCVALTGAGMSTASGVPDFRSPGGVWSKRQPVQYQEFVASASKRREYWEMKTEFFHELRRARPNAAHRALADLDRAGRLSLLVTQNIDGLHQAAGHDPSRIIEIHGTNLFVECLSCHDRRDAGPVFDGFAETKIIPMCARCGGLVKPATISFGQAMPEVETRRAFAAARDADVLIAAGSSLVVFPAAGIPRECVEAGGKLLIFNRDSTPYDSIAAGVFHGELAETLPLLVRV